MKEKQLMPIQQILEQAVPILEEIQQVYLQEVQIISIPISTAILRLLINYVPFLPLKMKKSLKFMGDLSWLNGYGDPATEELLQEPTK